MDLHKADDYEVKPTVEEIKRNHIADLAVQHKYAVKFLQYWINEEAGLVFCLMEAPDKESCIAVHQEAHGGMPCNVIELQGGDYEGFMGAGIKVNQFDIVEKEDGSFDTGYRVILVVDHLLLFPDTATMQAVEDIIQQSGGRLVKRPGQRDMFIFLSATDAIECALKIMQRIRQSDIPIDIRISISAGDPVTTLSEFFGYSIQLANSLCSIAQKGQIVVSALAKKLAPQTFLQKYASDQALKILNEEDELFLNKLMDQTAVKFYQPGFAIEDLSKDLGMSRSKLYRKITSLTGLSANNFIRELRLRKALQLTKEKYGNVNEIALEAGFTDASYFSKNFHKRFGVLPAHALKSGT